MRVCKWCDKEVRDDEPRARHITLVYHDGELIQETWADLHRQEGRYIGSCHEKYMQELR